MSNIKAHRNSQVIEGLNIYIYILAHSLRNVPSLHTHMHLVQDDRQQFLMKETSFLILISVQIRVIENYVTIMLYFSKLFLYRNYCLNLKLQLLFCTRSVFSSQNSKIYFGNNSTAMIFCFSIYKTRRRVQRYGISQIFQIYFKYLYKFKLYLFISKGYVYSEIFVILLFNIIHYNLSSFTKTQNTYLVNLLESAYLLTERQGF
eukprot:TRINITY_DN10064_c0_g1_i6.p1 TRINITY_DN10064_c0_g1~~TRINITY_DN10064_c0_g1_i6.p1  ORF type:complete len:217 (+),score=-15.36 TRINITY_DN10064_c0_g1_i6:40-651(+)